MTHLYNKPMLVLCDFSLKVLVLAEPKGVKRKSCGIQNVVISLSF